MNLLAELEKTRVLMIQSGMRYGFRDVKTIKLSEKLDELMNKFDTLNCEEQKFDYQKQKQKI